MKIIILAGGEGSRLWPFSREDFPKQFLSIQGKSSLLQQTVKRFLICSFVDEILIVTQVNYAHLVEKQLLSIDVARKCRIIIEPHRRNTAPAIALAMKFLEEKLKCEADSPILILPSDHVLHPEEKFLSVIEEVQKKDDKNYGIIFGIPPKRAESGFGYIKKGKKIDSLLYEVEKFIEKPSKNKALKFLAKDQYLWNSGMFLFSLRVFWKELQEHAPNIYHFCTGNYLEMFNRFGEMPNISIDYALIEKTNNLRVAPLKLNWSDLGSWDSVYDILEKDNKANAIIGNVINVETKNSLIIGGKRLISVMGLEDLFVIETPDALLLGKKGQSQNIKELFKKLQKQQEVFRKNIPTISTSYYTLQKEESLFFSADPFFHRYFLVSEGNAFCRGDTEEKTIHTHHVYYLPPCNEVEVENREEVPLKFLEVHLLQENRDLLLKN